MRKVWSVSVVDPNASDDTFENLFPGRLFETRESAIGTVVSKMKGPDGRGPVLVSWSESHAVFGLSTCQVRLNRIRVEG